MACKPLNLPLTLTISILPLTPTNTCGVLGSVLRYSGRPRSFLSIVRLHRHERLCFARPHGVLEMLLLLLLLTTQKRVYTYARALSLRLLARRTESRRFISAG